MSKIPSVNNELMGFIPKTKFPVELPVSDEKVEITSYTHNDSKMMLELMDDFKKKKKDAFTKLFSAMGQIIDRNIFSTELRAADLQIADFSTIMDRLRQVTRGEDTTLQFRCNNHQKDDDGKYECFGANGDPHVEHIKFMFDDCTIKHEDHKGITTVESELGDNQLIFDVHPYTFGIMQKNASIFSGRIRSEAITKFYSSFIKGIRVLDPEAKEHVFDVTGEQKIAFLNKLNDQQLKPLVDYVNESPKLYWEKVWECPICGKQNTSILSDPQSFFF